MVPRARRMALERGIREDPKRKRKVIERMAKLELEGIRISEISKVLPSSEKRKLRERLDDMSIHDAEQKTLRRLSLIISIDEMEQLLDVMERLDREVQVIEKLKIKAQIAQTMQRIDYRELTLEDIAEFLWRRDGNRLSQILIEPIATEMEYKPREKVELKQNFYRMSLEALAMQLTAYGKQGAEILNNLLNFLETRGPEIQMLKQKINDEKNLKWANGIMQVLGGICAIGGLIAAGFANFQIKEIRDLTIAAIIVVIGAFASLGAYAINLGFKTGKIKFRKFQ